MDPVPSLDKPIEQFVAMRGDSSAAPLVSRPDLVKQIDHLSQAYWDRCAEILTLLSKRSTDHLVFNKYERMTIDLGLLDPRLVPGIEGTRTDLLKELYAPSDPHLFYFSEWLAHRFRTFALTGRMESAPGSPQAPAGRVPGEDSEQQQYRTTRDKIYVALRSLFEHLPGFPENTIKMLFGGQMDNTIDELGSLLVRKQNPRMAEQRSHLVNMRQRMFARARERAKTEEQMTLFEAVARMDWKLESRLRFEMEEARSREETLRMSAPTGEPIGPAEQLKFIKGELNLVRSLLRLGVTDSGVKRTTPVLFSTEGRTNKSQIQDALQMVRECDPALPGSPDILVAPYIGTGFYEWDRDTVFVPLTPTRSVEEAVVTALANYRIMLDSLQGEGHLKRSYEQAFGKEDFRNGFIRDYKNWVLGVGKGFRGAMSPESFTFFRDTIGPRPDDLFAPSEIARGSYDRRNEIIKQCRKRINHAEGTTTDLYTLAVIYWKEKRIGEAMECMAAAVKIYPVDGRMMYSLGHICQATGKTSKAREAYQEVLHIAENTIWHIYASDALNKL